MGGDEVPSSSCTKNDKPHGGRRRRRKVPRRARSNTWPTRPRLAAAADGAAQDIQSIRPAPSSIVRVMSGSAALAASKKRRRRRALFPLFRDLTVIDVCEARACGCFFLSGPGLEQQYSAHRRTTPCRDALTSGEIGMLLHKP